MSDIPVGTSDVPGGTVIIQVEKVGGQAVSGPVLIKGGPNQAKIEAIGPRIESVPPPTRPANE